MEYRQWRSQVAFKVRQLASGPTTRAEETFGRMSFSQEGEDLVLQRLFEQPPTPNPGFYVDVGAHHPLRFSNTYFFYRKGWSGLNIDAMPGSMGAFNRLRPRDINVEAGVAEHADVLTYHVFDVPALNGFSSELSECRHAAGRFRIIDRIQVPVRPLRDILDEHLLNGQAIDFLSVDVEGLDLQVLRSNNWERYRPRVVIAEALFSESMELLPSSDLAGYMTTLGYSLRCRTTSSCFFIDSLR